MGHLPDGAHTHGSSSSGGLGLALAIGAGAVLAAAVVPVIIAVLHVLLIIVAVLAGLAVAAGAAVLIWRLRRTSAPLWQPGTLQPPQRPTMAPREFHLHVHGASAENIAQALARLPATSVQPPGWGSCQHRAEQKDQP